MKAAGWALVALAAFIAAGAIPVGVGFMLHPDGSGVGMPLSVLAGTPFPDFTVPGLVLALGVGGSQLAAGALVALGRPPGWKVALVAGAILAGWIAVQVAFIGYWSLLQPIVFAIAAAELALAWRLGR